MKFSFDVKPMRDAQSVALACKTAFDEYNTKKEKLFEQSNNGDISPAQFKYDMRQLEENREKYVETQKSLIAGYRSTMLDAVERFFESDGRKIDSNDCKILDAGIATSKDIVRLIEKHGENVTMLRIITKYADAHKELAAESGVLLDVARLFCNNTESAVMEFVQRFFNECDFAPTMPYHYSVMHVTSKDAIEDSLLALNLSDYISAEDIAG